MPDAPSSLGVIGGGVPAQAAAPTAVPVPSDAPAAVPAAPLPGSLAGATAVPSADGALNLYFPVHIEVRASPAAVDVAELAEAVFSYLNAHLADA